MPDKKISALTDGGALQDTDELVVARSGANYKIAGAAIGGSLPSGWDVAGTVLEANGNELDMAGGLVNITAGGQVHASDGTTHVRVTDHDVQASTSAATARVINTGWWESYSGSAEDVGNRAYMPQTDAPGLVVEDFDNGIDVFKFFGLTAPPDGKLEPQTVGLWYDSTNGAPTPRWKAKSADGTVVEGAFGGSQTLIANITSDPNTFVGSHVFDLGHATVAKITIEPITLTGDGETWGATNGDIDPGWHYHFSWDGLSYPFDQSQAGALFDDEPAWLDIGTKQQILVHVPRFLRVSIEVDDFQSGSVYAGANHPTMTLRATIDYL